MPYQFSYLSLITNVNAFIENNVNWKFTAIAGPVFARAKALCASYFKYKGFIRNNCTCKQFITSILIT